jgi:hypothetical protein
VYSKGQISENGSLYHKLFNFFTKTNCIGKIVSVRLSPRLISEIFNGF